MGLAKAFTTQLKLYLVRKKYLQVHIYCADEDVIREASEYLNLSYRPHKNIFCIVITQRKKIANAVSSMLDVTGPNPKLETALAYVRAETDESREILAEVLRTRYIVLPEQRAGVNSVT